MKKIISLILVVVLIMSITGCGQKEKIIEIGHKNFTEQRILGQMYSVLIEAHTDYTTNVTEFGGTNIAFEALKSGEVDVYPEYTGTAYGAILALSELKDPDAVYEYVKKAYKEEFNILWGSPLQFNNTYTFAVLPEVAKEYNLKTFTDLSEVASELTFLSTTEFLERTDGLPGVVAEYGGFEFADTKSMDPGIRYAAIDQKQGQVMDAFATDGKLIEFELVVLEDDKNFFPPYYVAPILNGEFSKEYPEVIDILNKLGGMIENNEMQQMNYSVDNIGTNERDVAEEFLRENGLID